MLDVRRSPRNAATRMSRLPSLARSILQQPHFAGLLVATFALGMAYSFVYPLLAIWGTKEVGMSPTQLSTFMTTTALSAIVLSTTLARWSDTHVPRKTMLILGGCGGVLGYIGYAYVRDLVALTIIGSTTLAVAAMSFSQLFAHVREAFEQPKGSEVDSGFLMSVVRMCFSVSWMGGPTLGAWMMMRFNWPSVFLGAAALYFVFLLGVLRFVPYRPPSPQARLMVREPVWRVLTRGDILLTSIAFVIVFAAYAINMLTLPLMVTEILGGNGRDLGIIFGVGPVVEIPLMLWFGHLAARGHQLRLIWVGMISTGLYFLLLSVAQAPWHVYLIQVLSGVSFAILTNVTILFFQDMLPSQRGLATTIFSNSLNFGNLVGFPLFGSLLQAAGHRGVFLVCASAAAAAMILLAFYRHRAVPPEPIET